MQYSLNKDHQHHKRQQQKSWISSPDCLLAQDKQQTQYLLIPGKDGRCMKITENSQKIGMSRHVDSSTTTQMAKIMVLHGRPSRSSWAKSVWSSFGRTIVRGNLRKSCESTVGRWFLIGNAFSFTVKKVCSYLCMWMTSNWLERNKTFFSNVESTQ